jgi:putative hydrolase of the HAD superfamily
LKVYKDIFFDLDHTLLDFDRSAREILAELYTRHRLDLLGIATLDLFIRHYQYRNDQMWLQYSFGAIDKETLRKERFTRTFADMGLDPACVPAGMSEEYVQMGPEKTYLMPFALETLDYLVNHYTLHIITNGFDDVQHVKLRNSGLASYFRSVVTSETAGCRKPDKKIFYHSLEKAGAFLDKSIMIGDTLEADILGAKGVGMDQVYFNPKKKKHSEKITYEINCISELKAIL